jgi:integrase
VGSGIKISQDRTFYREELKEEFLKTIENEGYQVIFKRVFMHSRILEEKLDKDLAEFAEEELDLFVREYIKPTSFLSAKINCRSIAVYLKFAQEKGMRSDNPFYVNENEFRKYQTVENSNFITAMDIDDITMIELVNANDALIVRLLFEGAFGYKQSEICNLTVNDIDEETNTITLHDDDKKKREEGNYKREIQVSRGTMELIRSSKRERIYRKKNGEMDDSNPRIKTEVELMDSPYILRPTKTTNKGALSEGKITQSTIYYRLGVIKEVEALKMASEKWNTKVIQRSGMLWQALKIVQKKGELKKSDYQEIASRFGHKADWHLRDVINVEAIEKVYGENYMEIDTDNF